MKEKIKQLAEDYHSDIWSRGYDVFTPQDLVDFAKEIIEMTCEAIKLPERDHSKCPIPETCIGYQSAESDLENIKQQLLNQL